MLDFSHLKPYNKRRKAMLLGILLIMIATFMGVIRIKPEEVAILTAILWSVLCAFIMGILAFGFYVGFFEDKSYKKNSEEA